MKKRTIIIGLLSLGLCVAAFWVLLLCVAGSLTWRYLKDLSEPRELPLTNIPAEFRTITGRELPKKADGLRAIFQGGMDSDFFVRFETDAEGIEHIKRLFTSPASTSEHIAAGKRRQTHSLMFSSVPRMQDKLGICLFDEKSIESGLLIQSPTLKRRGQCSILIDEQRDTVYIYAGFD